MTLALKCLASLLQQCDPLRLGLQFALCSLDQVQEPVLGPALEGAVVDRVLDRLQKVLDRWESHSRRLALSLRLHVDLDGG